MFKQRACRRGTPVPDFGLWVLSVYFVLPQDASEIHNNVKRIDVHLVVSSFHTLCCPNGMRLVQIASAVRKAGVRPRVCNAISKTFDVFLVLSALPCMGRDKEGANLLDFERFVFCPFFSSFSPFLWYRRSVTQHKQTVTCLFSLRLRLCMLRLLNTPSSCICVFTRHSSCQLRSER